MEEVEKRDEEVRSSVEKKVKKILKGIKEGKCMSQLTEEFPDSEQRIKSMMSSRPKKHHVTHVFVYGHNGVGKMFTTLVLKAVEKAHPEISSYWKRQEWTRSWNGYDNQTIVVVDDVACCSESDSINNREAQTIKNLICGSGIGVYLNPGFVKFDSVMIIVISDCDPVVYSERYKKNSQAIEERVAGEGSLIGSGFHCEDKDSARILWRDKLLKLCSDLCRKIGIEFRHQEVLESYYAILEEKTTW